MINLENKGLENAIINDNVGNYVVLMEFENTQGENLRVAVAPQDYTVGDVRYLSSGLDTIDVSVSDDRGLLDREAFTITVVDTDRSIHSAYEKQRSINIEISLLALHRDSQEQLGVINWTGGELSHVVHTVSKIGRGTEAQGVTTFHGIGLFPKISAAGTRRTTKNSQEKYLQGVPDNVFDYVGDIESKVWGPE